MKDNKPAYLLYKNDLELEYMPSKYLKYLYLLNESPNTIKASAFALLYYFDFLENMATTIQKVVNEYSYHEQIEHFTGFLQWIKGGNHTEKKTQPKNKTCNQYLRVVFQFYQYATENEWLEKGLKAVYEGTVNYYDSYGVKNTAYGNRFKGYLQEEDPLIVNLETEEIKSLIGACQNLRDKLLISIMAETGLRLGEVLGLYHTQDIDVDKRIISVNFRDNNENQARAKNAEHRSLLISEETNLLMVTYISEYYELLKNTEFLFVKISGKQRGEPLTPEVVYSLFRRLKKLTGIKAHPHQLRHYFANERRKYNWDLNDIRFSLGHKKIETTIKYLGVDTEKLTEITEQYFEENEDLFMMEDIL